MKKFTILIPVYNDWDSLEKLILEINDSIKNIENVEFNCLIVNDSSTIFETKIKVPSNIASIKLINMRTNKGHARCLAFGIRYLAAKRDFDHVILMDGDGEDRPEEIKLLVSKSKDDINTSVVAKRIKRSEGFSFQLLYKIHKLITLIFTGKNINFGNYSCLTKEDVEILSTKESLWSSFSGSLKYHINKLNSVNSFRGIRYYGSTKMSFLKLIIHSFSIIAVFKKNVFLRSAILLILISNISIISNLIIIIFQMVLVLFNLIIFIISLRENKKEFLNSRNNVESEKLYMH
jgi:polyisoprenyl-phosphate glycosyltransferase